MVKKRNPLGQERCATQIISSFSGKQLFTAVHIKWYGTYITERLDCVRGCYIAEVKDNCYFIILLRIVNMEQLLSGYVTTSLNLKNVRDAICIEKDVVIWFFG